MLTRLHVRNFKCLDDVDIELGQSVVFIGPNNSGKTVALQALALWDVGRRKWQERRRGQKVPEQRPGVTINRRDLLAIPVPHANLLWRDLHVRDVQRVGGEQKTRGVLIEVTVEGVTDGQQ
jgi:ABC-type branched-subunit amino acid transport system ATPase component